MLYLIVNGIYAIIYVCVLYGVCYCKWYICHEYVYLLYAVCNCKCKYAIEYFISYMLYVIVNCIYMP